jgi:hypothetical protein
MSALPGRYGGYGVRTRPPGNARMVTPEVLAQESNQRIMAAAQAAISQPFTGLTADGTVVRGLFSMQETGISTQRITDAAETFIALCDRDGPEFQFPADASEWRLWANNTRPVMRHGVLFESMTPAQREAALEMVRASLSQRGFETVRGIMKLNETLAEISGYTNELGEWIYFLSLFGTPSMDEPWGWQIDGHHLIVNCFILGDQMVLTPVFMGAEPVLADRGKYAGTHVLQDQERNGLELMWALTPAQREQAVLFPSVLAKDLPPGRWAPGDGRLQAGAHKDNFVLSYEGVRADSFTRGQQEILLSLIQTYVGYLRPGHDRLKMEEIKAHLDQTHFAWIGRHGPDDVFYYRVHSPVIFIEFDHQNGVFLDNDDPEKFHMHTVVRTPNGNDYGRDLLRQHYERHHHG